LFFTQGFTNQPDTFGPGMGLFFTVVATGLHEFLRWRRGRKG
jgi:hypothetical protein